ncbi:uncharacterized protein batf2 [Genypterus blacodes]|uniref:uncharacterized protein batf2 n=1 Tax=Genypterus blacodes TaxID=154954 RepID=UPI003F75DBB9
MTLSFMDAASDSPDSLSTAGTENEGVSHQRGHRGHRRQKNRDAARKSRKKQTERADELHTELQCLERSKTILENEITALKKKVLLYTSALEHHEPVCRLRGSSSSSSPSARVSSCPSPAGAPLQADPGKLSSAVSAPLQTSSSSSSSFSSSSTCQTECAHLSSSPSSSSPHPSLSSLNTSPPSFCAAPSPHSLFAPVCTSLVSDPVPSTFLNTATLPHSSASTKALDSVLCSSLSLPYPATPAQDGPICLQLHEGEFRGPAADLDPPAFHHSPDLQHLSVSPGAALDLALKPTHCQQNAPYPPPLLSLLSSLNAPQNTSSTFTGPLYQPPKDLSLSELLEGNAWILDGSGDQ